MFATYLNLKMARLDGEKNPTLKSPTPQSRRVSASNVLRLGRPAVCRVGLALTLTTVDRRVSLSRTISSRGVVSVASAESAFMTPKPKVVRMSLPTGRRSSLHRRNGICTRSPLRCKYNHQRRGKKNKPLSDLTVSPSPGLRWTLV